MKLVMPTDLARAQGMAFDARIGEKRCAERSIAEPANPAPDAAKLVRVKHRVREHQRSGAAAEQDFAHEHACAPAMAEHEALVAIGSAQALEKHLDPYARAALRDARGERAAVGEPGPIGACGSRRRLPVGIAGGGDHGENKL